MNDTTKPDAQPVAWPMPDTFGREDWRTIRIWFTRDISPWELDAVISVLCAAPPAAQSAMDAGKWKQAFEDRQLQFEQETRYTSKLTKTITTLLQAIYDTGGEVGPNHPAVLAANRAINEPVNCPPSAIDARVQRLADWFANSFLMPGNKRYSVDVALEAIAAMGQSGEVASATREDAETVADFQRPIPAASTSPAPTPSDVDALIAAIRTFLADAPKEKPHTGYRYGELLDEAAAALSALKAERDAAVTALRELVAAQDAYDDIEWGASGTDHARVSVIANRLETAWTAIRALAAIGKGDA